MISTQQRPHSSARVSASRWRICAGEYRVDREFRERKTAPGAEDAQAAIAVNFIKTDILQDLPLELLSRTRARAFTGALCLLAIGDSNRSGALHRRVDAGVAARRSILVPTGTQGPTPRGTMADAWTLASKRPLSS